MICPIRAMLEAYVIEILKVGRAWNWYRYMSNLVQVQEMKQFIHESDQMHQKIDI